VLDRDPAPLPKKGTTPIKFSPHVYSGQTTEFIRIPLGTEVGLSPGNIVLDGHPAAPSPKGAQPPIFRSSPGDDLIDWKSSVSVRPSTKSFSDFDQIWCVGRPRLDMPIRVTSTRSKSRSRSFRSCKNCTFLGLSPPPFSCGAQN